MDLKITGGHARSLHAELKMTVGIPKISTQKSKISLTFNQIPAPGKRAKSVKALIRIQVLDARNRILGEHAGTIRAMANLALTYRSLAKYTEAEKLEIQPFEIMNRALQSPIFGYL